MEYYINSYTDYGDYVQQRFEYQEGIDRAKGGSTTFIIKGRTPPSYDISNINSGRKGENIEITFVKSMFLK